MSSKRFHFFGRLALPVFVPMYGACACARAAIDLTIYYARRKCYECVCGREM